MGVKEVDAFTLNSDYGGLGNGAVRPGQSDDQAVYGSYAIPPVNLLSAGMAWRRLCLLLMDV